VDGFLPTAFAANHPLPAATISRRVVVVKRRLGAAGRGASPSSLFVRSAPYMRMRSALLTHIIPSDIMAVRNR
jgi:hypothetical protein